MARSRNGALCPEWIKFSVSFTALSCVRGDMGTWQSITVITIAIQNYCIITFILFQVSGKKFQSKQKKNCIIEFVSLPHWYCKYWNSKFECILQNDIVPLYHNLFGFGQTCRLLSIVSSLEGATCFLRILVENIKKWTEMIGRMWWNKIFGVMTSTY